MNLVIVTGRVATTPEMKYTVNGKPFCKYRLAIDSDYVPNREKEHETEFVPVIVFTSSRDVHCKLRKGVRVLLRCKLKLFKDVQPNGSKIDKVCLIAQSLTVIDTRFSFDPIEDLRGSDGKILIPKELTTGLMKTVNRSDVDIPDDI